MNTYEVRITVQMEAANGDDAVGKVIAVLDWENIKVTYTDGCHQLTEEEVK